MELVKPGSWQISGHVEVVEHLGGESVVYVAVDRSSALRLTKDRSLFLVYSKRWSVRSWIPVFLLSRRRTYRI
jgi:hypothetical protein